MRLVRLNTCGSYLNKKTTASGNWSGFHSSILGPMNMKTNLAHEPQELQQSRQCHLCGVVDDYTSYFQSKYEQLICFECMSDHSEWYLSHVSKLYVDSKSSERLERMYPSSGNRYKKKKISHTLRMQVYERDGFACVTCGVQKNLSLDHIKPEVLGGESTLENLQTMCTSCNSSKGARYVETPDQ